MPSLLKARLCARSFTYIILFNPPTNSARFFLFYLADEERRLGKVKQIVWSHDRETGSQTGHSCPKPVFFSLDPTAHDWPDDEVIRHI